MHRKNIWCTASIIKSTRYSYLVLHSRSVFLGLTLLVCVCNSRFATLCKYEAFLKPGYAPRLRFTSLKKSRHWYIA